jgi:hypothetical protein
MSSTIGEAKEDKESRDKKPSNEGKDENGSQNPRLVYKGLWKDVKQEVNLTQNLLGDLSKDLTIISDAADLGMQAANYGSEHGDWESGILSLERLKTHLTGTKGKLARITTELKPVSDSSTGSAIFYAYDLVSPLNIYAGNDINPPKDPKNYHAVWSPYPEEAHYVWIAFNNFFNRTNLKDQVLKLMKDCGFNKRQYGRQAIERFRNAWDIYEQHPPVDDPSIGSLISLREAIRFTIDTLSQLRLYQTDRKEIIREIGKQLAAPSISQDIFTELDFDINSVGGLNDSLSGAKENVAGRDHETTMMQKGSLFLQRLLGGLDQRLLNMNSKERNAERRKRGL